MELQNFRIYDCYAQYRITLAARTYSDALIAAKSRGIAAPMVISEADEAAQNESFANQHDYE